MYIVDAPPKKNKPVIIKKIKIESPFQKSKRIQTDYEAKLRGVSREVRKLILAHNPVDLASLERLKQALYSYAKLIEPWSKMIVEKMILDVSNQDKNAWRNHTKEMSLSLQKEILNAPTGEIFRQLMEQNVELIKSIPIEVAQKVHEKVIGNLGTGARPTSLIEEIMKMGGVTLGRATTIARTETSRAANTLTQVRAQFVGSEGYIWRTSKDLVVRLSHRKMNGVFVKWAEPPELDGMVGHAGCLPNCRCFSLPVIPEG